MRSTFIKILFLLSLFFIAEKTQAQYNWITPNQTYLKLYVTGDGIYRLGKTDFTNAGVPNVNSINPRTVKVLYKGAEIPIFFQGENDGVFNDTDYFDFYGKRNYGGLTKSYDENNSVAYTTDEYYNQYSDTSVYWVGWGGANGLRYQNLDFSSAITYGNDYFYTKIHFEKDRVYNLGETLDPNSDYRYFNTEKCEGEGWYWQLMKYQNTITDTFSTAYKSASQPNSYLKISAYPNNYSQTIFNEHRLTLRINDNLLDTIRTNDYHRIDTTIAFSGAFLNSTGVNNFTLRYSPLSSFSTGQIYFDYLEFRYPRRFEFESNYLSFTTELSDTSSRLFRVKGFNAGNEIKIYDIKNGYRITNYTVSGDTLFFSGKGNGNFEIANISITKKPFRIKQKQVPDLVSIQNGADHIIVYNKLFQSQAEQLRAYRSSHDTMRAVKAEIEDIYDIFNYGMEDPTAVKNFLKYAYFNWQAPKVRYVLLFGRGSLDPKKSSSSSNYYQNLVPVYGNPSSDGYFVNFTPDNLTYFYQISTGRLPAYSMQEAQDMVNKIISYDGQQPEKWFKEYIFIAGGLDSNQQIQNSIKSEILIANYVLPPPISGHPVRIYRRGGGYVTYNYSDSIRNSINRGSLIVNYIGHAASSTWDTGLEDPSVLNNGTKLPLVLSMTCFTGKNAETSDRTFSEKFMYLPGKGSVGFIGSTGWSFSETGNHYNALLYESFAKDSVRRIGDILKSASDSLSYDSTSFVSRNTINSYNLLGDPATKLLLPVYPEFDVQNSDYTISNISPAIRENFTVTVTPKNLGLYADSCKLRFQLIKNTQVYKTKDTVLKSWGYLNSASAAFTIDSTGFYQMKIILDPENRFPNEIKSNNSISFQIILKNIAFDALKPLDNSVVKKDTVEFVLLNPGYDPHKNNIRALMQLDTTQNFNSPFSQMYFNNNISGVATKFKIRISLLDTNLIYFWRTNSVINGDSSGWSVPRRFIYNATLSSDNFLSDSKSALADTSFLIYKKSGRQYSESDFTNTVAAGDSITLKTFQSVIIARSHGENEFDASYITINNSTINLTGAIYHGLNIAKVRKTDGAFLSIKNFRLSTPQSSDSVVNFLNGFDSSHIMILVKQLPTEVTDSLRQNAISKIKEFGSVYADSVKGCRSWDKWAFVCYRKSPNQLVSEAYLKFDNVNWLPVTVTMPVTFRYLSGSVSGIFGPSQWWKYFSLNTNIYSGTDIRTDVYGITRDNLNILLYQNLSGTGITQIDTLSAYRYPSLKLVSKFSIDTISGTVSPALKSLTFRYVPPAELVPDVNSFVKSDSVVQEGDTVRVRVKYYNEGFLNSYGITGKWSVSSPGGVKVIAVDTITGVLNIDSSREASVIINTARLRKPQLKKDTIFVFYEISPREPGNDVYTYNNTAVTSFIVTADSLKPDLDVTVDGLKLQSGDNVQSKPTIIAKFSDDSKMVVKDTSNIIVYNENNRVPYYIGGQPNPELQMILPAGKFLQATVKWTPTFDNGEHNIKFVAIDNSGNYADTIQYTVNVNPDLKILDLYTFPNPMKNQTKFICNLSGANTPSSCKIKVYTVSGRLVKTLILPASIGFNTFDWDGTDDDGDKMANGVYLYKLIVDGDSKKETAVQKLVILK